MSNPTVNERDLVLGPDAFAYVQDRSQGEIGIYVGPHRVSLSETDQPVIFDGNQKRFVPCNLERAIQSRVIAPEGWYVVMKNPALQTDGTLKSPGTGKNASKDVDLNIGRKINIAGPCDFPLWPGQMTETVQGHHLRSNQYLLVRVYDEEQAKKNRAEAVIKKVEGEGEIKTKKGGLIPDDLSIGKLFTIKGTDASFFIPPTGIEIVKDNQGNYIRKAETLEVLDYCILLDENGNKRLPRGPAVVFPEPTESFVTKKENGKVHRKFGAFELNEKSGLYIKVIKAYEEEIEGETIKHPVGEELFITGADDPVYFPREEHAIIKYGKNKKIQYAVALPSGEGRYVLNRNTGEIGTRKGPDMFLPDPRNEVLVKRVLSPKETSMMFPGNTEAAKINKALNALAAPGAGYVQAAAISNVTGSSRFMLDNHASGPVGALYSKSLADFAGDELDRGTEHTPPRTITIDNKYDGIVGINVWTGYAVNIVKKDGTRRVVEGPNTVMLDYDETLESFSLSRGTPKIQKNKKESAYLKCMNNRVTDKILVQTKDLVDIELVLAYSVNFTGNPNNWFNVDDYVGLLTDRMRSVLRNASQQFGIEDLWADKIDIIRDTILGSASDEEGREGRFFEQNGMKIVDVDFVDAKILDEEISALLVDSQHDSIRLDLVLQDQKRSFDSFVELESLKRAKAAETDTTNEKLTEMDFRTQERKHNFNMTRIKSEAQAKELQIDENLEIQDTLNQVQEQELTRQQRVADHNLGVLTNGQKVKIELIEAETTSEERRIKAITPDLIAAMTTLGQSELAAKLTEELSPLAILGGQSVAEVGARLLGGLGLDKALDTLSNAKNNGVRADS